MYWVWWTLCKIARQIFLIRSLPYFIWSQYFLILRCWLARFARDSWIFCCKSIVTNVAGSCWISVILLTGFMSCYFWPPLLRLMFNPELLSSGFKLLDWDSGLTWLLPSTLWWTSWVSCCSFLTLSCHFAPWWQILPSQVFTASHLRSSCLRTHLSLLYQFVSLGAPLIFRLKYYHSCLGCCKKLGIINKLCLII